MGDLLHGLLGISVVFLLAYLLSYNRREIRWRPIIIGFAVQFVFALIVLKWSAGREMLKRVSDGVSSVISYANEGIMFLFGGLYSEQSGIAFVMAFNVLPLIIFFASLIAILYHLGIMQLFIKYIGGAISKLMGTSQAESVSAAANIFVGYTEAPLVIKPYIANLTRSEMFAVLTGGLASVSGSVLASYSALGVPMEYLIAGAFMSAPAGLVLAKIVMPETEQIVNKQVKFEKSDSVNVVDAAANGAIDGLKLAANVGALLLAFVALIALANGLVGWVAGWFGYEITIQQMLGYLFAPLVFAIGVPWNDAVIAGSLLGQKLVLNEFVAYIDFAKHMKSLDEKTIGIMSFALLGFANVSSMAVLIGGVGGMAPTRRGEIAKVGLKVILAGALASVLNGAIAGMLL
ncbi:NupC/NupG family nucleoside CNT transporter [Paenibacillus sp. 481]|uniref:NupC/NupG family nucleoside CNT transporter n=1 Tax=Paenibacillus sp. 481 TaxID=2835869 RepID=UPI001E34BCFB|nr:NupC/NupG family nucleoside CNT transporter [Paenibacillus sp. 481]UHA72799.1 NupC/NupG family nucleoside CNT transporter [Paenibacillus sp. 481]